MIYRLLISSILVLYCTSMTGMRAAIKKEKEFEGTQRASYETMKEAYEFRIEQLKKKVAELEQNQAKATSGQETMAKLDNLEQLLAQLNSSTLRSNPTTVSVPEITLNRYYGCVKETESWAIKACASYQEFIEKNSGTYIKDSDILQTYTTSIYYEYLSKPSTTKIFTQHPDFLKLCEIIKRLKPRIAQLEIPLETGNRILTFMQQGWLLSTTINSFDAMLEEVKKSNETK